MTLIPIAEADIVEYHGNGVPAFARLYANQQFTSSEGILVAGGSKRRPEFWQEFTASLVGNWIHLDEGNAYATTNSNRPGATCTLVVYDANGRELLTPYSRLRIPHSYSSMTWAALESFSAAVPLRYPPTYLDSLTLLALLEALSFEITQWGGILGDITNQLDLQTALNAKQALLISGTNIKTLSGQSVLGSGDLDIVTEADLTNKQDTLISGVNIKTLHGASLLGAGNLIILDPGSIVIGGFELSNIRHKQDLDADSPTIENDFINVFGTFLHQMQGGLMPNQPTLNAPVVD